MVKKARHEYFYYYAYTHLQAVRDREWKLILPRPEKPGYMGWWARKIDAVEEIKLFHILDDKEEKYNLAEEYPEKVSELMKAIEYARLELGDKNIIGNHARFFDDTPKTERLDKYNEWQKTKRQTILHDSVFTKINEASKLSKVFVLKTDETIPYSSVFLELDCKYWTDKKENDLSALINTTK